MAIELLGLRTVIYQVTNLDMAARWWSEFLGYQPYFREPFYVGFEVAGYELGLLPSGTPDEGAITYWGVSDVPAAIDAAVAVGSSVHTEPSEVGEGIVTGSIRTPDGSIVGFILNPHFTLS